MVNRRKSSSPTSLCHSLPSDLRDVFVGAYSCAEGVSVVRKIASLCIKVNKFKRGFFKRGLRGHQPIATLLTVLQETTARGKKVLQTVATELRALHKRPVRFGKVIGASFCEVAISLAEDLLQEARNATNSVAITRQIASLPDVDTEPLVIQIQQEVARAERKRRTASTQNQEGPIPPDKFRFEGQTADGIPRQQLRLLECLEGRAGAYLRRDGKN